MAWETPKDAGGPVEHLDQVFKQGNAPRFHGMLKKLAEANTSDPNFPDPVYVDIWKIDLLGPNDKEFKTGENINSLDWNAYSILAGSARSDPKPELSVKQFFYHADILSGQDVGTVPDHAETVREDLKIISGGWVERALNRLEAARICRPDQAATDDGTTFTIWSDLFDHFNTDSALWDESWTAGRETAGARFEDLRRWYDGKGMLDNYRLSSLEKLGGCLAGFAALIHGARLDIDNLMGVCVDRVHAWDAVQPDPYENGFGWALLSNIAGFATATGGLDKALIAVDVINGIAGEINRSKKTDTSEQCYDILSSYLTEADAVLDATMDGVDSLLGKLGGIRDSYPTVPVW